MRLQDVTTKTKVELQNLSAEDKASLKKELRDNWAQLHDKLAAYNVKNLEAISENDFRKLYPDTTKSKVKVKLPQIDKSKIISFVNLAKHLKKDEFISFMGTGEVPPIKLTPQEMELVAGGLHLRTVAFSLGASLSSLGWAAIGCVAICCIDAATDKATGLVY